ncbi:DUF3310 domain-containing protein [Streptomyces sp. NPDC102364]|uniref:DUF3310 domain-containing protein n=1 Tax=Streptomyces sp. NPDC102364 TaxID=3366161 RepID=UPI0037F10CF8
MKYKAGDQVVILKGSHEGKSGVIVSVDPNQAMGWPNYVRVKDLVVRHLWCSDDDIEPAADPAKVEDSVNQPSHYTWLPNGFEVIDLIEHLTLNRGNAVKYLARAGRKSPDTELEDLKKAAWYVQREIKRLEATP